MTAVRGWSRWPVVMHSLRTAVAAVTSLLVARLLRLPATFWAPITTLVITQSSLGAAWTASRQRFIGTIFGALLGAFLVARFGSGVMLFGLCVFLLGLLCAGTDVDRNGYRFGGVTLAIVMLIPRTDSVWRVAFQRFSEVSVGIAVALLLAVLWPEQDVVTVPVASHP